MDAKALRRRRRGALGLVLLLLATGSGCSTPVGVERVDPRVVYHLLTSNVLSTGELSNPTRNVLYRRDFYERFERKPQNTLAKLHAAVAEGKGGRDEVFALAELSFLHASRSGKRRYFLASMVYAYAFLFPGGDHAPPAPTDPRLRLACDLYNRGITEGFTSEQTGKVELRAGEFELPFGTIEFSFDESQLIWANRRLVDLIPVADLEVRGMWARYRWPGIGAPFAASLEPLAPDARSNDFVAPWAKIPITAVVRIESPRDALASGRLRATLELDDATSPKSIEIDGREVPIEIESTAALAYTLAESPVWQQEIKGFLQGAGVIDEKSRLLALAPYQRGRIPVVLVHGTASSAGRWAQLLNELGNDPRIHEHYQFWLYSYDTGNPVLYSAMRLRETLTATVARLQRDAPDPALARMVVIGHSQGGLLTKLTAVDSGDRFWRDAYRIPLDKLVVPARTRNLLEEMIFVEPLPFVRRLIFIATPQHGSYFAGNPVSHWIARFVTLPLDLVHVGTDLLTFNREALALASVGQPATSVDNMTPGSGFIRTLAAIPVTSGVATHSIIAVRPGVPFQEGDDGVVSYQSAHLDDTESELVVLDSHSCQSNPHTVEEVRRILLEHLDAP